MKFQSPVYSNASGSIAGITYSRNRYGMYTRARATPVNPQSTRQSEVRSAFAAMVDYWTTTLSAAQRAAWDTYAANTPVTDPLGQTQYLTGQSMFLRANTIRERLGLAAIAAAPTDFNLGTPVIDINSIVVAAGDITFDFDVGGAGTETTCQKIIRIGVAQNASRTFFKGPYQLASFSAGAAATTNFTVTRTLAGADWLADYQPAIADVLPAEIRILYDDGRLSLPYREIVTVA